MSPSANGQIPLVFGQLADAGPQDALLIETDLQQPTRPEASASDAAAPARRWFQPDGFRGHLAGCACCTHRSTAAMALAWLILERGRGSGMRFPRIIAVTRTPSGRDAVRQALIHDPVAAAYVRESPLAQPGDP